LYATRSLLGDALANLDNKKNLRVYVVDFGKSGKLDRPVNQALPLADAIDAVMDETGEQHVNLVAHSMGGLSSRYLIQVGDPAYAHRVANLVMIGTPNHGSDLALQLYVVGLRENLIGGQKLTGDQKAVLSMVKELARSRALPDLAPQSVFLNSLNYGDDNSRYDSGDACDPGHRPELIPSAGGTQYWTIAGTGNCEGSFFNWFMGILGIDTEACESDGVVPVSSVRLQSVDATHHALDTELSGSGGLLAAHIADLTTGWGCWDFVGELQHPGIISATLSILTTGSMSTISPSALAEESIAAERRPARTAEAPEFAAKAFPNPASRNVTVQFAVPWAAPVSLRLYDPAGRLVRVLVDQWMPAGEKSVVWDRVTDAGRTAGAGVYFYELRAGNRNTAKKLLLLR
jgi:pimeloyl-ACP methyl ester carboxylesterase